MYKLPKLRVRGSRNYYIKFRVHKCLISYFNKSFIIKALGSHKKTAEIQRVVIYDGYANILKLYQSSILSSGQILNIINKYISEVLNQLSDDITDAEIPTQSNVNNEVKPKVTYLDAYQNFKTVYDAEDIKPHTKNQTYQALEVFLEIIGKDTDIKSTELYDLIEVKKKIETLGSRNYKEYRTLPLEQFVSLKSVPKDKMVNDGTVKAYIKHIKKFFVFCTKNRIIPHNPAENLQVKVNLDKKDPFTQSEIDKMIEVLHSYESDAKWLYLSIIYTGMRRAEIYNSTIEVSNGIRYFQVHQSKTKSGLRKIPLHPKLDELTPKLLESAKLSATNAVNAGAIFAKYIKPQITTSKRKTLHSIRHYVANMLKKSDISDSLIKTILGHTQDDVLNTIYARDAYTLQQLNEAIKKL